MAATCRQCSSMCAKKWGNSTKAIIAELARCIMVMQCIWLFQLVTVVLFVRGEVQK